MLFRSHAEVDLKLPGLQNRNLSFNSRPHAEVDFCMGAEGQGGASFNSRPHAEVDRRGSTQAVLSQSFQLTTSRRGRHVLRLVCPRLHVFQLTTSRRGRPPPPYCEPMPENFQLTTSRRGRPFSMVLSVFLGAFNSRPHAEVDEKWLFDNLESEIFQLTTSRRGRPLPFFISSFASSFQLTTSRRGRLSRLPLL